MRNEIRRVEGHSSPIAPFRKENSIINIFSSRKEEEETEFTVSFLLIIVRELFFTASSADSRSAESSGRGSIRSTAVETCSDRRAGSPDAFSGRLSVGKLGRKARKRTVWSPCASSNAWLGYCSGRTLCHIPGTCEASHLQQTMMSVENDSIKWKTNSDFVNDLQNSFQSRVICKITSNKYLFVSISAFRFKSPFNPSPKLRIFLQSVKNTEHPRMKQISFFSKKEKFEFA